MHQDQALLVARGVQQGTVRRRLNSISWWDSQAPTTPTSRTPRCSITGTTSWWWGPLTASEAVKVRNIANFMFRFGDAMNYSSAAAEWMRGPDTSIQIHIKCTNCSFYLVFRSSWYFWPKWNFSNCKIIKIQGNPCQFFFWPKMIIF